MLIVIYKTKIIKILNLYSNSFQKYKNFLKIYNKNAF